MAIVRVGFMLALLPMLAGCDLIFGRLDILDAAEVYRENPEIFARIRAWYKGPLSQPRRIPAFDESDDKPEDVAFLEEIKQSIPVESIQLYRRGIGADVIDVSLGSYGIAVSGSLVGVVFFQDINVEEFDGPGVRLFDACDERAPNWLASSGRRPYTIAYCRLDDNWYAYQSIT